MKLKIKQLALIGGCLVVAATLTACGSSSKGAASPSGSTTANSSGSAVSGPSMNIKLASTFTADSPIGKSATYFADQLKKATQGRLTVTVYPNEELGPEKTVVEGLANGTQQMCICGVGTANLSPELNIPNLPYIVATNAQADALFYGNGYIANLSDSILSQHNITGLAYVENGFRSLTNNVRPVKSPSDAKGLKIRAPSSPPIVNALKAWGAQPTVLSADQLYSAMQSGVVQGQENGPTYVYTNKFYEVQKYLTLTNYDYVANCVCMSSSTFNKLSPEEQAAVKKVAQATSLMQRKLNRSLNDTAMSFLKAHMQVYQPTPSQLQAFERLAVATWDQDGFSQQDLAALKAARQKAGISS